jgi:sortase A
MDDKADTNNQPPRGSLNSSRDHTPDHKAAADLIRSDIDRIYDGDQAPHAEAEKEIIAQHHAATSEEPLPDPQNDPANPALPSNDVAVWKHYHTSWQSYYQQYYERYYLHHLHNTLSQAEHATEPPTAPGVIASDNEDDQAVAELRDKLLDSVKEQAETVRKSRHFAPIATAVAFALVFLFLQYNRFMFATVQAYVSPGNIDPQNIIVDPQANMKVGPEPKLIIPKINVEAPMIYGVNSADVNAVEDHLRGGVVHYPIANASSVPGQNGATVILGHSSNDVFDSGAYKFVFVQLNKLEKGDTFYINYQGTRYTYSVASKEIIDPKEISKVAGDPAKPSAILITCDPPGTALKRLLVFANQISPDPSKSTAAPSPNQPSKTTNIAGQGTTFIERLFGVR